MLPFFVRSLVFSIKKINNNVEITISPSKIKEYVL